MHTASHRPPAAQGRDITEFEAIFLSHYEAIYRHLFRLLGSPQEAEDLAQETFLRLYRQEFAPGRDHNVRAWLYRVATRLAYNALRAQRARDRREQAAAHRLLSAQAADPAEEALRRDEAETVRKVLLGLRPRDAQLLLLRYAGLKYREVAEVLGVAPGSVGTLLARAEAAFEQAYRAATAAPPGEGSP
ncbi:MAG: sigma-70 family RNA polymerase sigma factor [Anaerolineae bacterium]|nr:sigma-70 family RNA polymerase sigma factor [Anaerolineae bacterium]